MEGVVVFRTFEVVRARRYLLMHAFKLIKVPGTDQAIKNNAEHPLNDAF